MYRALAICFAGLIMVHTRSLVGNSTAGQMASENQKVERAESHPALKANFDGVTQLKIATRKTNFHLGEMITVDIALLNASSRPLFFRKLSDDLQIKVRNATGQTLTVQRYGVADKALVPSSFVRVLPKEIVVRSFHLLAGCDKRAFAESGSSENDDLAIFRKGLFLNWGDACLPNVQPGTYNISVEISNDFVLFPSSSSSTKTAVGKTNSNSLEIEVHQ
jgi:hypothetical protein